MTDDELELRILERFVARFDEGEIADPDRANKCARELDMREVLRELTGKTGPALNSEARRWLMQLAPGRPGSDRGPLRLCSNNRDRESVHQFHARAFLDPNCDPDERLEPDPCIEKGAGPQRAGERYRHEQHNPSVY